MKTLITAIILKNCFQSIFIYISCLLQTTPNTYLFPLDLTLVAFVKHNLEIIPNSTTYD